MTIVSNSSPLIILAKLGHFDFLNKVYPRIFTTTEVHHEVVAAGAGLPGASDVAKAEWIEVRSLRNHTNLMAAQRQYALGLGELSTILLAKELRAVEALLDDYHARKLARQEGLEVRGSVGLLETFYRRGYLSDLRATFYQLLSQNVYIDKRL